MPGRSPISAPRPRGSPLWSTWLALLSGTALACATPVQQGEGRLLALGHQLVTARMPANRLEGPYGVRGVVVNGPLAWIVPVDGGVVVVDTGWDPTGEQLRAAIGPRRVLALLLTHGHPDHVAGGATLRVPSYLGRADLPLAEAHVPYHRLLTALAVTLHGTPPLPPELHLVDDGDVVAVGGARFTAVALPGHTPGSMGWLFRDLLLSGDAVVAPPGRALGAPYTFFTEQRGRAERSVARVLRHRVAYLCDGHYGCADDVTRQLRSVVDAQQRAGRE